MDLNVKTGGKGSLEALVPRGLVKHGRDFASSTVSLEGLCPVRIEWEEGLITSLELVHAAHSPGLKLLLPRLVEPHAHIDKSFTWEEAPNFLGNYEGALEANLKEQEDRTFEKVHSRAERALRMALGNGIRAVRSHVDSFGIAAEISWEALLFLKKKWKSLIELQLVALAPLEYWSTDKGSLFAARVASEGGLLGGVIVPPFDRKTSCKALFRIFHLANQLGCGIDLHVDESEIHPAAGLKQLINVLDQIEIKIPVSCSHLSSMSLLPSNELRFLANRLAHYRVNVVALPLTNAWLLGRRETATPVIRPLAPIFQLQQAGVTVAVGSDNVQDPWFPVGNFDPLSLMSFAMPLAHLAPWTRLGLSPFTTAAASLMGLEWDGTIQLGSPADFVLLDACSWIEAMSSPPGRKLLIHGRWFDMNTINE